MPASDREVRVRPTLRIETARRPDPVSLVGSPRLSRRASHLAVVCLAALAACGDAAGRSPRDPLTGSWRGTAVFRGARLDFSVRFTRQRDTLRATLSSPDLLLLDQPLDGVAFDGRYVRFSTPDEQPIRFDGVLRGDEIRGGAPVPAVPGIVERRENSGLGFTLRRAGDGAPPPYSSTEVTFPGEGVRLAGTLLVPRRPGPHAGVVILQGSSGNLRREYRFYADHFARAGLAVLTFDKRGRGESTGSYGAATYDDLAADAAAAVRFLRTRVGVDSPRVGTWGLSQGGFITPWVAARVPLAFVVAVSAPGMPIARSAAYQDSLRVAAAGLSAADAARAAALNRQLAAWLRTGAGEDELSEALAASSGEAWRRASALPARLPTGEALRGWYWRGRTVDPLPAWHALRPPALLVFGAADELVPAPESAARITRALREGGNRDVTVRVYPAANHVIRRLPLAAGGAWDWPRAAPGYLDGVTAWMVARTRR
jgi:dienelactone hydrolase